jgi:hypothetical protein
LLKRGVVTGDKASGRWALAENQNGFRA